MVRSLNTSSDAVIQRLEEGDAQELFRAISEELRESDDDRTLRYVLQLLTPSYWPQLDEVARLRSENRLIVNLQDGRYIRTSEKCSAGGLTTWSKDFWPYFSLKEKVLRVLCGKLRVNQHRESRLRVPIFLLCARLLGRNASLVPKAPITCETDCWGRPLPPSY